MQWLVKNSYLQTPRNKNFLFIILISTRHFDKHRVRHWYTSIRAMLHAVLWQFTAQTYKTTNVNTLCQQMYYIRLNTSNIKCRKTLAKSVISIVIYRTPYYVIIWKSYTLLKMVQFFLAHPVHSLFFFWWHMTISEHFLHNQKTTILITHHNTSIIWRYTIVQSRPL